MIELKPPAETDRVARTFAMDLPNRAMLESVLAGRNPDGRTAEPGRGVPS